MIGEGQSQRALRAVLGDRSRRQRSERFGRLGECVAMLALAVQGYRVVARRVPTPWGEIDLVAVRGRRLAFVEVKARQSLADAGMAVSVRQARRLARAAEMWVWRRPGYRDYEIGLDRCEVAPWCWPRLRPNALQPV